MAMFPALSELFSSRAPAAPLSTAQAAAAANATASGSSLTVTQESNPTVPSNTTIKSDGSNPAFPATKEGDASPLSGYQELWKAAPVISDATTLVPTITADPAAMLKAAQTIDFTKAMDPALLSSASKGDATALASIINQAAQAGYAQAAIASVNITKAALGEQARTFETKYAPNMLRENESRQQIQESVLISNDPAAAPIVEALRRQLTATYPTASAAQIATHTANYLQEFAQKAVELAGGKVQTKSDLASQPGALVRGDTDWSNFFGVDPTTLT